LIAFAGSWHATDASAGQDGPERPRGQPPLYVARFWETWKAREPLYAWLETKSVEKTKKGKNVGDIIVFQNMFDVERVNDR